MGRLAGLVAWLLLGAVVGGLMVLGVFVILGRDIHPLIGLALGIGVAAILWRWAGD